MKLITNMNPILKRPTDEAIWNSVLKDALVTLVATCMLCTSTLHAQTDIVYVRENGRNTQVKGKITDMTADTVSINTKNGAENVDAGKISKIKFSGEPSQVERARKSLESGRYDDCLKELDKIKKATNSQRIKSEIEFLRSYANAQKALRGDNDVTAQQAGSSINQFVKNNQSSHHFYRASESLGQLFLAIGKLQLAEKEFTKLTKSTSASMQMRGAFQAGQVQLMQNNLSAAKASMESIKSMPGNDDAAKQQKLIAECKLAKIAALGGDPANAIASVQKIIAQNDSNNAVLFAHAYNALGQCYLKSDRLKPASRAFLRTHLLFANDSDAHAEALYNLALIWPKLNHNDRANEMRQTLKSRYRNSYWASKL